MRPATAGSEQPRVDRHAIRLTRVQCNAMQCRTGDRRTAKIQLNQASSDATQTSSVARRDYEHGKRGFDKEHTRRQLAAGGKCDPGHKAGRQSKAARPVPCATSSLLSVPSAGCVLCASANKQTNKPVAAAVSSSSPPSHGLACIGLPPSPLAPQAPDAARLWSSGRAHTHQWRRGNWNRTDASYGTHFPLQWTRTAGVCDRGQPNRSV
jgi:hypothetical protein